MNAKQERFCREYVKDLNASQAYIRAGYSKNGAGPSAKRLLNNAKIKEKVRSLQEKLRKRQEITLDKVVVDLLEDRDAAREKGVYTAAIRATMEIAKLHGLYEKHNRQQAGSLEHLSREELLSKIKSLTSLTTGGSNESPLSPREDDRGRTGDTTLQ